MEPKKQRRHVDEILFKLCTDLLKTEEWSPWKVTGQFAYNNINKLPDMLYIDSKVFSLSYTTDYILAGNFKMVKNEDCYTINDSQWTVERQPDVIPGYLHHYRFWKQMLGHNQQDIFYYIDSKICYYETTRPGENIYKLPIIQDVIQSLCRRDYILDCLCTTDFLNSDVATIVSSYAIELINKI